MIKVKVEAEGVTIERELTDMQWAQVKGIMMDLKIDTGNGPYVRTPTPGPSYMVGDGDSVKPPGTWVCPYGSYKDFREAGWEDRMLIEKGYLKP